MTQSVTAGLCWAGGFPKVITTHARGCPWAVGCAGHQDGVPHRPHVYNAQSSTQKFLSDRLPQVSCPGLPCPHNSCFPTFWVSGVPMACSLTPAASELGSGSCPLTSPSAQPQEDTGFRHLTLNFSQWFSVALSDPTGRQAPLSPQSSCLPPTPRLASRS